MEDQEREAAVETDVDGLEEDDLELSLGLRPAPSRRRVNIPIPPEAAACERSGDLSLNRVWFPEMQAKREEQALRRQEAMKKRDDKRKSKANGSATDSLVLFEKQKAAGRERNESESEEDFSERHRKGERCKGNGVEGAVSFLVRPAGGFNGNQLNGLPCLMMPGLVGSDPNGFQPVMGVGGAGGFQPYQVAEKNSGHGGGDVGNNVKRSVSSCSRGSSPGVSDYQSTSGQGGSSSDGGSHCSHSHPLDLTITNGPTMSNGAQTQSSHECSQPSAAQLNGFAIPNSLNGKAGCSSSPYYMEPSETLKKAPNMVKMATALSNTNPYHLKHNTEVQPHTSPGKKPIGSQSPRSVTNEAKRIDPIKPPKPPMQQSNEAMLLSQMPCVSTTGNGPNGKTISGFLYRYTKSEVSIVCVCHGTSFSPAGFVEHAGGVDVENPLRCITVVPFAYG